MKVALMTIFQVPNYGSVLQAFATQIVLEKIGLDCRVIDYHYPNQWHFKNGIKKVSSFKKLLKKVLEVVGLYENKERFIDSFRKDYLKLVGPFKSLDSLKKADWSDYAAIISGSDQVWNYRFHNADSAFMLSFVEGVKKISIASSFACTEIPTDLIPKYYKWLNRFDAISVRESNGDAVFRQIGISKKVSVMLDPTLLLSSTEWDAQLNLSDDSGYGKYVLLYIQDYAFNPRPYINHIAEYVKNEYGCDNILTFSGKDSLEVRELGAISVKGCSVEDFVNYIRHAEVVVTSSFHGSAFAINYSRPLVAVYPDNDDERMQSLLKLVGIEGNGVSVGSPINEVNSKYDVKKIQERLDGLRKSNYEWIRDALEI